jgi:hypothetical protein
MTLSTVGVIKFSLIKLNISSETTDCKQAKAGQQ